VAVDAARLMRFVGYLLFNSKEAEFDWPRAWKKP
jgi:hypothetical protein